LFVDPFGRVVKYLRISVTDRCDFRCVYCMDDSATFLPRPDTLTFSEIDRIASLMIADGVRRVRITGGEPLTRTGVVDLIARLSRHIETGALDEITLTTNGGRLADLAGDLFAAGVRRVNVSLDSLDPAVFRVVTRWGRIERALAGIEAALAAGLKIRVNAVILRDLNEDEATRLVSWAGVVGVDLAFIEIMPMGRAERADARFVPLCEVVERLRRDWTLTDLPSPPDGTARWMGVVETGGRIGLISPVSHAFCGGCDRARLTCDGRIVPCLGHDDSYDLRGAMRSGVSDDELRLLIANAVRRKPWGHDFARGAGGTRPSRGMSVTGG